MEKVRFVQSWGEKTRLRQRQNSRSPVFFSTKDARPSTVSLVDSRVIDTDEKLAAFLPKLHDADWIAVDTEADSLHAYPEKLFLLQVSIAGTDELLDPLSSMDLRPALE